MRLVKDLVTALNTKNVTAIRRYVETDVISNAPFAQRVRRWADLASQGAPFKIVRDLSNAQGHVTAIVLDKNSIRIALTLYYTPLPRPMVQGFGLAPAFRAEGCPPDLAGWQDLRSLASSICNRTHAPAMAIALIRNGVASEAMVGVRVAGSRSAVQKDDVWSIGSIAKSICATVIGKLIETHKLRWDETLREALPGIPMNESMAKATLEEVMQHRAGIPEETFSAPGQLERLIGPAVAPISIRDRFVTEALNRKPVAAPGSRFFYSNAGYVVLSHIAERTSGKPYEQMVKDVVFKPLNLQHSYMDGDLMPNERPLGHIEGSNGLIPTDDSALLGCVFAGSGEGVFMSAEDLARFGEAHLAGLRGRNGLLKASTIQRLHRGLPEQPSGGRLYACGWGIEKLPGMEIFHGHNGSGNTRAELAIFPKAGLVVVGITNRGGLDEPSPGMLAVLAIGSRYAPQ